MNDSYPVLVELALAQPAKRLGGLIPSKRPLSDLPIQEPGSVLVFEDSGGNWTQARGRLNGTEHFVVNAISVSLVRTRMQTIDTQIEIPSFSAADDFTIKVQFNCRVVEPERVAQQGPMDLRKLLADFLRRDRGLLVKGQQSGVEDIKELRIVVDARIRAYCDEIPPQIPGMEVSLSSVEVLTPDPYREHATKVRDTAWAREIAEMLARHQDVDVRRLAAMFSDPEMIAAVAKLEDKIDMQVLFNEALVDRRAKDANILELLKLLEKNGQLDRLPIDARSMVNTLMNRLAGTGLRAVESANGDGITLDAESLGSIGAGTENTGNTSKTDKEERFAVDSHTDE